MQRLPTADICPSKVTKAGVPSDKVIVGVTSYGRSFAMSQPGCFGPQCTFLGTAGDSPATKGRCTGTSGYLSNAEIKDIIADRRRDGRVNQNYVDESSHTNILVYDDTQWVGWMDDDVKASRAETYKHLNMGGVADWASDLQQFNDPPLHVGTWPNMISKIKSGQDPVEVAPSSGNWNSLTCTDSVVEHIDDFTPAERWAKLGCSDAFQDALDTWKVDHANNSAKKFSSSVSTRFRGTENTNCGVVGGSCDHFMLCDDFHGKGTGPAAYEVWNSFVWINLVSLYSFVCAFSCRC